MNFFSCDFFYVPCLFLCKKNQIHNSFGFSIIALQMYREILKKYRKGQLLCKLFFQKFHKTVFRQYLEEFCAETSKMQVESDNMRNQQLQNYYISNKKEHKCFLLTGNTPTTGCGTTVYNGISAIISGTEAPIEKYPWTVSVLLYVQIDGL